MLKVIDKESAVQQLCLELAIQGQQDPLVNSSTLKCELLRAAVYEHLNLYSVPIPRQQLLRRTRNIARSLEIDIDSKVRELNRELTNVDIEDDLDALVDIGDLEVVHDGIIPTPSRYIEGAVEGNYLLLSGTPAHLLPKGDRTESIGRMRISETNLGDVPEYSFDDLPPDQILPLEALASDIIDTSQQINSASLADDELAEMEIYVPNGRTRWQQGSLNSSELNIARIKNRVTSQNTYLLISGGRATQLSRENYFVLSYFLDEKEKVSNFRVERVGELTLLTVYRPPPRSFRWRFELLAKYRDKNKNEVLIFPGELPLFLRDALVQLGCERHG